MRVARFPAVPLIALGLFTVACSNGGKSPTGPTETSGTAVHYTFLGASDGIGFGGSIVCAPFDLGCENGTGYAQTIRRRFLADGRTVGIIDVPGHEDFLRNMVAGAASVDAVLLVVAATEGVMPQTAEHVRILRVLRQPPLLAVITKTVVLDIHVSYEYGP